VKSEWVTQAAILSRAPADLWSGNRKILTRRVISFGNLFADTESDDRLELIDGGYTQAKMRYLERNYIQQESLEMAISLWDRRRTQERYGSVGVSTYGHLRKADPNRKSKHGSVQGPCIQSFTLTWENRKSVAIDVFYRTTEWFKKFPADLVFLRDVLIPYFNLEGMEVSTVNCYFANISVTPMFFVTVVPNLDDPVRVFKGIHKADPKYWKMTVKWTAIYVCPEFTRGIDNWSQAKRAQKDVMTRTDPSRLKDLQEYLRQIHPRDGKGRLGGGSALPLEDEDD
jgi:hypothetical protein